MIIAFGSNLGDRFQTIKKAKERIEKEVGVIEKASKLYETKPLICEGRKEDVGNYVNGVISLQTSLLPHAVLKKLSRIEQDLGRVRQKRWDDRTIDLDLIAVGEMVIQSPTLTVPHPEMHKRSFVLGPMLEIAPTWFHPILRKTTKELFLALEDRGEFENHS